ncbi:hypothetical protein Tco_1119852 [Tanacetum coccineum]
MLGGLLQVSTVVQLSTVKRRLKRCQLAVSTIGVIVIVNGDAPAIALASAGTEGLILPKTNEQKLARKNELKVKSTLLLAIPDGWNQGCKDLMRSNQG